MYSGDVSVKGREFQFSMVTDKKFSGKGFKLLWKGNMPHLSRILRRNKIKIPLDLTQMSLTFRIRLTDISFEYA